MVARVIPVSKFDLVLFGATGDLARRKIWPGLFHRFLAGQFDTDSRILGVSRSELSDDQFRTRLRDAIELKDNEDPKLLDQFLGLVT